MALPRHVFFVLMSQAMATPLVKPHGNIRNNKPHGNIRGKPHRNLPTFALCCSSL